MRQRDAVQAENEDLRRRLSSVLAIVQPAPNGQGLSEIAAAAAQQSPLPLPQQEPPLYPPPPQSFYEPSNVYPQNHLHPELRNRQPSLENVQSPNLNAAMSQAWPYPPSASSLPPRGWSPNITVTPHTFEQQQQPQRLPPTPNSEPSQLAPLNVETQPGPPNLQRQLELPHARRDEPLDHLSILNSQYQQQQPSQHQLDTPQYARLPLNIPPTCQLDSLLLDFLAERRRLAPSMPPGALVGPAYPSISSLLNPSVLRYSHPLSRVFTDVLSRFPDLSGLPEQVAVLYIAFLVMRWEVCPSQENYDRLPKWVRVTEKGTRVPHAKWVDNLPWPAMRDRLITSPPSTYPFERFIIPYTSTLSLNWPYDPSMCLLPTSPQRGPTATSNPASATPVSSASIESALQGASEDEDEEFGISPVFEMHLRDLNNWSLGPAFQKSHPDLCEGVRIKD
ncbi:hypothetical protein LTR66_005638 [Elasticomyces elasticus]|nr:hypothetical protein LTR66_005638 [Elasticomyces elasticus]